MRLDLSKVLDPQSAEELASFIDRGEISPHLVIVGKAGVVRLRAESNNGSPESTFCCAGLPSGKYTIAVQHRYKRRDVGWEEVSDQIADVKLFAGDRELRIEYTPTQKTLKILQDWLHRAKHSDDE